MYKRMVVITWDNDYYVFPVVGPTCEWTRTRQKLARKLNRIMGRPVEEGR